MSVWLATYGLHTERWSVVLVGGNMYVYMLLNIYVYMYVVHGGGSARSFVIMIHRAAALCAGRGQCRHRWYICQLLARWPS